MTLSAHQWFSAIGSSRKSDDFAPFRCHGGVWNDLCKALAQRQTIVIEGPIASGKTMLLRHIIAQNPRIPFVGIDDVTLNEHPNLKQMADLSVHELMELSSSKPGFLVIEEFLLCQGLDIKSNRDVMRCSMIKDWPLLVAFLNDGEKSIRPGYNHPFLRVAAKLGWNIRGDILLLHTSEMKEGNFRLERHLIRD